MDKCNEDVYRNGTTVFTTHSTVSPIFDLWVRLVAAESNQSVDWHMFAGRSVVKTTGDVAIVLSTLHKMWPQYMEAHVRASKYTPAAPEATE
jgi:hypothetical protein